MLLPSPFRIYASSSLPFLLEKTSCFCFASNMDRFQNTFITESSGYWKLWAHKHGVELYVSDAPVTRMSRNDNRYTTNQSPATRSPLLFFSGGSVDGLTTRIWRLTSSLQYHHIHWESYTFAFLVFNCCFLALPDPHLRVLLRAVASRLEAKLSLASVHDSTGKMGKSMAYIAIWWIIIINISVTQLSCMSKYHHSAVQSRDRHCNITWLCISQYHQQYDEIII